MKFGFSLIAGIFTINLAWAEVCHRSYSNASQAIHQIVGAAYTAEHYAPIRIDPALFRRIAKTERLDIGLIDDSTGVTTYFIRERKSDEIIGSLDIVPHETDPNAGWLAISIRRNRWRMGYGRESEEAVLEHLRKREGFGFKLYARIRPENEASIGLHKQMGFTPTEESTGGADIYLLEL